MNRFIFLTIEQWYYEQMELSLLILVCIDKSYIAYLEIYVVLIGHGFSFFFWSWKSHGKSTLKKRGHPVHCINVTTPSMVVHCITGTVNTFAFGRRRIRCEFWTSLFASALALCGRRRRRSGSSRWRTSSAWCWRKDIRRTSTSWPSVTKRPPAGKLPTKSRLVCEYVTEWRLIALPLLLAKVRTGTGKPWNLKVTFPGLESRGIRPKSWKSWKWK